MNSIKAIINKKSGPVLSMFFTAGYPALEDTVPIINALSESGVDFIEVGMPYSDPMADGPTIQESSATALKNGMNLDLLFEQLESIKETNETPLVLMGYLNQMLRYGEDLFLEKMQNCGIKHLILPDLPMHDYLKVYKAKFKKYGISNIFLISPQTSDERIRQIDQESDSFIYVVGQASITGASVDAGEAQEQYFKRLRKLGLQNPKIVGFGIDSAERFKKVTEMNQGAIIGTAFIKDLTKNGVEGIGTYVKGILG